LKNEADKIEARLRNLLAKQPVHAISTRKVAVVFEHPLLRVEDNRVKTVGGGAEGNGLRILPGKQSRCALTVLPLLEDARIVLVIRYRYAPGRWSLEFPRGQESAADAAWADAAERILSQVCGLDAQSTRLLGAVNPDPRMLSGSEIVVLAEGCVYRPDHEWDDQQFIAGTLDVPMHCLDSLIVRGRIDCGTSLAALCLYRAQYAT